MELTEHLLYLSRQLEEKADEAQALLDKIADLPIRVTTRASVYHELLAGGHDHQGAWRKATQITNLRNEIQRLIKDVRTESEVLASIADDVIGVDGRLV